METKNEKCDIKLKLRMTGNNACTRELMSVITEAKVKLQGPHARERERENFKK